MEQATRGKRQMQGEPTSILGRDGGEPGPVAGNGATGTDETGEIARLRRRLAFYEGFDDLIQQNISRSGDLLRLAAERQAEAERELSAEREDLARTAAAQRDALAALAADLAGVRAGLDALASRLETARAGFDRIAAIGQGGRDGANAPVRTGSRTETAGAEAHAQPRAATIAGPVAGAASQAQPNGPAGDERRIGAVIVHGIAGVEDARSYQTWLASRPGVQSVTPREFAAGILRLDVTATPFPAGDAAGWPGHALEVVDIGPGTTVLRLRGAASL